uniref:(northern house mosquito) hypothetical protein n=1 Tax=Culex pipiens TaxID=7175 RepID=A0A8D8CSL5_CULPI
MSIGGQMKPIHRIRRSLVGQRHSGGNCRCFPKSGIFNHRRMDRHWWWHCLGRCVQRGNIHSIIRHSHIIRRQILAASIKRRQLRRSWSQLNDVTVARYRGPKGVGRRMWKVFIRIIFSLPVRRCWRNVDRRRRHHV